MERIKQNSRKEGREGGRKEQTSRFDFTFSDAREKHFSHLLTIQKTDEHTRCSAKSSYLNNFTQNGSYFRLQDFEVVHRKRPLNTQKNYQKQTVSVKLTSVNSFSRCNRPGFHGAWPISKCSSILKTSYSHH